MLVLHKLYFLRQDVRVDPDEAIIAITKVFKNGNSQAVRIPADLAYSA